MALAGLPEELVAQIRGPPREKQQALHRPAASEDESLAADNLVYKRVYVCSALLRAARAAVRILGSAGRELQQAMGTIHADPAFKRFVVSGDPPTAALGRELLQAYHGLGAILTSLASITKTDMVEPLQDMHRNIQKDTEREQQDLIHIQRHEAQCSSDVRESIMRKDKASRELQNALHENEKLQNALPGFLSRLTATKLESQVHQAANLQTIAVEELAIKMDRAALARHQREKALSAFQELLSAVDDRCTSGLKTIIMHCATAWINSAPDLQTIAERLNSDAACSKDSVAPGRNHKEHLSALAGTSTRHADVEFESVKIDPDVENTPAMRALLESIRDTEGAAVADHCTFVQDVCVCNDESQHEHRLPDAQRADDRCTLHVASSGPSGWQSVHEEVGLHCHFSSACEMSESCHTELGSARPELLASPQGKGILAAEEPETVPAALAGPPVDAESNTAETPSIIVFFDEEVVRLGFEVLWEEERPVVGHIIPGGAAEKNGVLPGDVLTEISGTNTQNQTRADLMPLLKARPLGIKLERRNHAAMPQGPVI